MRHVIHVITAGNLGGNMNKTIYMATAVVALLASWIVWDRVRAGETICPEVILPVVADTQGRGPHDRHVFLTLEESGRCTLGDSKFTGPQLDAILVEFVRRNGPDIPMYLAADQSATAATIAELADRSRTAGFFRFSFVVATTPSQREIASVRCELQSPLAGIASLPQIDVSNSGVTLNGVQITDAQLLQQLDKMATWTADGHRVLIRVAPTVQCGRLVGILHTKAARFPYNRRHNNDLSIMVPTTLSWYRLLSRPGAG